MARELRQSERERSDQGWRGQERRQFAAWLRTGRLTERAPGDGERSAEFRFNPQFKFIPGFKFNPWHDPEDGRFTTGPGHRADAPGGAAMRQAGQRPSAAAARLGPAPGEARNLSGAGRPGPAPTNPGPTLGRLSAQYETGGRGVGTVSRGIGHGGHPDRGGVSYGSYQLTLQSSVMVQGQRTIVHDGGSVAAFLHHEGAVWAPRFAGMEPGSPAFTRTWQDIATRQPAALHAAEHAYVKRTAYDPAVAAIRAATGIDLDRAPLPIREALWSTAVQHGPGSLARKTGAITIFVEALRRSGGQTSTSDPRFFRILASAVYQRRTAYWKLDKERYASELSAVLAGLTP